MWLGHYLLPPTQSPGSLYKVVSATVHRRSSPVLRQFRATRTMRKTRLVILPGVRSITQIGCLLLFLACPTIAFKGQEKRDVEPICKFHELKYWWLPFDTGEGENSTRPQKWTGYRCQRNNVAKIKGKDNVTDSIQHSCDESVMSHGYAVIHGQDANYNLETNFGRNRRSVIHSLPSSVNTNMSSKRTSFSEHRTTDRNEIPQLMYETERISPLSLERRVAFYKDQRLATDRQSSFSSVQTGIGFGTRTMIQNRLQQNSREGSETKGVNERRRSILISGRGNVFKKARLSSRINPEFTVRYYNLERLAKRNDQSEGGALEKTSIFKLNLKRQENNGRATLSFDRKHDSGKHPFNSFIRLDMNIREKKETKDREERSSNDQRRVYSGKREVIVERTLNQYESRKRAEQSDKRILALLITPKTSILDRRIRENNPPQQNILQRQCSSTLLDRKENVQRSTCSIYRKPIDFKEQSGLDRRLESSISIEKGQSLPDRRSIRSFEPRVFSLNRRMEKSDIRRDIRGYERDTSRENIVPLQNILRRRSSAEHRENILQSAVAIIEPKDSREQSRINRRFKHAVSNDNEQRLSNRRSERSVEVRGFSLDRIEESNVRRDTRLHEKDASRENNSLQQNTLRRRSLKPRENIQRSAVSIILLKEFEERSRIDRSKRAISMGKEQRLSDRRPSARSVESRVISLARRMAKSYLRLDIGMYENDSTRRIRSERDNRNENRENISPLQNMLRRQSSTARPEHRETTDRATVTMIQPDDYEELSRLVHTVSIDNEQCLFNRRSAVESRGFTIDRRVEKSNIRLDIRKNERCISLENVSPLQNMLRRRSSSEPRENIKRSAIEHKDSREPSRITRRFKYVSLIDNEQHLSDKRRSERSAESRDFSLDGRIEESNLRRGFRLHEKDISLGNIAPLQNLLRREISLQRKKNIQRAAVPIIQFKDSKEQSRINRRIERAVSINNVRRLSTKRKSERSIESRVVSLDRRMTEFNVRRDIGIHEKVSTRRIRSDILRDNRNEIRENLPSIENVLFRHSSPARLERRETTQGSVLAIIQPKGFEERSRLDRRVERAVYADKEQSLFDRRPMRSVESPVFSLDRRVASSNERRDIRVHKRDISRDIISPLQNMLRRRSASERKENILRAAVPIIQSQGSREQSRINRRIERDVSTDYEQRLSARRRSERSVESRVVSLDRRMTEFNVLRDIGMHGKNNTRRIRVEISRESRNEIRENIPSLQNTLRRQSSPARLERRETTQGSVLAIIQPKGFEERSRLDRRVERAVYGDKEQSLFDRRSMRSVESPVFSLDRRVASSNERRDIRVHKRDISRDNISPLQNMLRRRSASERKENILRAAVPIIQSQDSREQSRINRRIERDVSTDYEQRLSARRRSERSVESRVVSLDRRMTEFNVRRDIGIHEKDSTRRIRSDILRDNRNEIRENLPSIENVLFRHSSPARLERRETTQGSVLAIIQPKGFEERSRLDRRVERAVYGDKEQSHFDRRSIRSVESPVFSLDRRVASSNERRDIRVHKRDISRDNISPLQNMLRRRSASERRENILRAAVPIIQSQDSREQSRINRMLGRAVSTDYEQRLSARRRSERSVESRVVSLDRRMTEFNVLRDIGMHGKNNTRRIRVEISRESRNEIRENIPSLQNTLRRQSSPARLERRETTQGSVLAIIQPKGFEERSRLDRRVERAVYGDKEQSLFDRRSMRSVESPVFSLDRRVASSNERRDIRVHKRDISRDNISPLQNMLRRRSASERRENILRAAVPIIQSQDSREQSRINRRIERAVSTDYEQRLSARRRSERSVESRVVSLDRRMTEFNVLRDIRIHEKDSTRRIRSDILRDNRNEIRENLPQLENMLLRQSLNQKRRETRHRSVVTMFQPTDYEVVHRMDRRSVHSVESRLISLDRRMLESNLRRYNRNERDISRENTSPLPNTLRRQSSLECGENIKGSAVTIIQPKDFKEQSKMDRRLERSESIDNEQRLSGRRAERSVESRVYSLDRRMADSYKRRDIRVHERDISHQNIFPLQNMLQRRRTTERRENIQRSTVTIIESKDSREQSRIDRRFKRSVSMDKEQRQSDRRRSLRSIESHVFSLDRRMTGSNLRRDIGMLENDSTRRIRETTKRSSIANIQPKDFMEQLRIDRRLERAVSIDNEQRLSDGRRSVRSVESRFFSLDRRMAESSQQRDIRTHEKDISREELFPRRLKTEMSPISLVKGFREHRRFSDRFQISLERKFEVSLIRYTVDNVKTREDLSRINQRYAQERSTMLNQRDILERKNVLRGQTLSSERYHSLVSTKRSLGKVQTERREERFLDNGQYRLYDNMSTKVLPENRGSRSEKTFEFIRVRRDIRDISNNQFLASEVDQRNYNKQSIRSSSRRAVSPESYTSYPERKTSHTSQKKHSGQKPSNSRQRIENAASISRVSKSELQNHDEVQIFNAQKNNLFFPSWIGKMIFANIKAVTGSNVEENILKHPKDSALARINKYPPGFTHERQIPELRPDSEITSNNKGHLLQDFVLGSVIAGYFYSSIHLKIRDYRNFICIF